MIHFSNRWLAVVVAGCLLGIAAGCNSKPATQGKSAAEAGSAAQAVSEEQEPYHKLVFQNEYTRVFAVELPAGKSMLLHRHDHDYVSIVLGGAAIETQVPGQQAARDRRAEGDARFIKGGFAHRTSNVGNTVFRNLIIEVLKSPSTSAPAPTERSLDIGHGHTEDVIVDNAQVRVTEVQVSPGAATDEHTHKLPHLFVPLTGGSLLSVTKTGPPQPVSMNAGQVQWMPAGNTHLLRNTGKQTARWMAVEFKG